MKIIKANELQELTELGQVEFVKNVLEGPLFKSILASMEDAALNGRSSFEKLFDIADLRAMNLIKSAFIDAGYECEIKIEKSRMLLNLPYTCHKILISWDKK